MSNNPYERLNNSKLNDESKRVLKYFSIMQTEKVRHFYTEPLLKRYVEIVFATIMLGLKDQAPEKNAVLEARHKSKPSSELKFEENVLEDGKGGSINKQSDDVYSIVCESPADIVAGKIITKRCDFPIVTGYTCLEEMKEQKDINDHKYHEYKDFYTTKCCLPISIKSVPGIDSLALQVPLGEYIDASIQLLEETKSLLELRSLDYYQSKKHFDSLVERVKNRIKIIQLDSSKTDDEKEEDIASCNAFLKGFTYEKYMAFAKNHQPPETLEIKRTNPDKLKIQEIDKKLKILKDLRDQHLEGTDYSQVDLINSLDDDNHQIATNFIIDYIKEKKSSTEDPVDLSFDTLLHDFQSYSADNLDLFNTLKQFERLLSPQTNQTKSGELLEKLGVKLSKKKMKYKVLENGFVALFIFLDTPLGTIELQIQTESRFYIQKFGTAAHSDHNKAPIIINFPHDLSNPTAKELSNLTVELDTSVPKKMILEYHKEVKDSFSVSVGEKNLLDNYDSILSETNSSKPSNLTSLYDAIRGKIDILKNYLTNRGMSIGLSRQATIKYYNIEQFARDSMPHVKKLAKNYALPTYDNKIFESIRLSDALSFFQNNPKLDPIKPKIDAQKDPQREDPS